MWRHTTAQTTLPVVQCPRKRRRGARCTSACRGNIRILRHALAPRLVSFQTSQSERVPLASGDDACKRLLPPRIPPEHAEKARCPHNAPCKRIIPAQDVRYSNPLFQHAPLGLRLNSSAHHRATGPSRLTRNNVSMTYTCHIRSVPRRVSRPATKKRPLRASSPSLGLTHRRKTHALLFPNI